MYDETIWQAAEETFEFISENYGSGTWADIIGKLVEMLEQIEQDAADAEKEQEETKKLLYGG